jgi:YggT family protein
MLDRILITVFDVLYVLLMIRILVSWIPHNRNHPFFQLLYRSTDPLLEPFQRMFPARIGIDFSPIFAFMFLGILKNIILRIF